MRVSWQDFYGTIQTCQALPVHCNVGMQHRLTRPAQTTWYVWFGDTAAE